MYIPKPNPLVAAVLVAVMGTASVSAPLYAAIRENVSVTPVRTVTPREEAAISSAGVNVLRHITQARARIENGDSAAAQAELDKSDKLLDIIGEALPRTSVRDHIWIANKNLDYEDTHEELPDLVPIYSSLDEMMDIMPARTARAPVDKAGESHGKDDGAKAGETLEDSDAAMQYTEVDLPLSATRRLVSQARSALENDRPEKAAGLLQTAEDSVIFVSVGMQQPLFAARTALYQGLVDLEAGNRDLAQTDLKNAVALLTTAGQSPDAATRDAAGQLLDEAQRILTDLQNGDSPDTTAFRRLFERAQAYADRAVEYIATGWERYRAEGKPLKSDLIEARLHLVDAKIDLFTGHEPERADRELGTASGFLRKAAKAAGELPDGVDRGKQAGELQSAVETLRRDLPGSELSRYTRLQRELDDMIEAL